MVSNSVIFIITCIILSASLKLKQTHAKKLFMLKLSISCEYYNLSLYKILHKGIASIGKRVPLNKSIFNQKRDSFS